MTRPLFLAMAALGACAHDDAPTTVEPPAQSSPEGTELIPSTYLPYDLPSAPTRVIFVGDSITAGFGADVGLAYADLLELNDDEVWPEFHDESLTVEYGPIEAINVAVPGATTGNVVVTQLQLVADELGPPPWTGETLVIMTAGGNDLQFAIPRLLTEGDAAAAEILPEMEANLETVLDFFLDPVSFPDGAHVFYTNVYEPTDAQGQAGDCLGGVDISELLPYLDASNERFLAVAEERDVGMIDLRTSFLGHGMNASDPELPSYRSEDPSRWLADDCIHPNERGHHELRRLFWGAIHGEVR